MFKFQRFLAPRRRRSRPPSRRAPRVSPLPPPPPPSSMFKFQSFLEPCQNLRHPSRRAPRVPPPTTTLPLPPSPSMFKFQRFLAPRRNLRQRRHPPSCRAPRVPTPPPTSTTPPPPPPPPSSMFKLQSFLEPRQNLRQRRRPPPHHAPQVPTLQPSPPPPPPSYPPPPRPSYPPSRQPLMSIKPARRAPSRLTNAAFLPPRIPTPPPTIIQAPQPPLLPPLLPRLSYLPRRKRHPEFNQARSSCFSSRPLPLFSPYPPGLPARRHASSTILQNLPNLTGSLKPVFINNRGRKTLLIGASLFEQENREPPLLIEEVSKGQTYLLDPEQVRNYCKEHMKNAYRKEGRTLPPRLPPLALVIKYPSQEGWTWISQDKLLESQLKGDFGELFVGDIGGKAKIASKATDIDTELRRYASIKF